MLVSKLSKIKNFLSERPFLISIVMLLSTILWMASGGKPVQEDIVSEIDAPLTKVKVEHLDLVTRKETVSMFGKTEASKSVAVVSEAQGQIKFIYKYEGDTVKKGELIAIVDPRSLVEKLNHSKVSLKLAEIELDAAQELHKTSNYSRVSLVKAEAKKALAESEFQVSERALRDTAIFASFDGVLNESYIEEGSYVSFGTKIYQLSKLDPISTRSFVTERQVKILEVGQKSQVTTIGGQIFEGVVRYVSKVADEKTNTYRVEVGIDNTDLELLSGMSVKVVVPTKSGQFTKISPALLSLDEEGNVGIKVVESGVVKFIPVDFSKSESDGIWITGLPESSRIITLGQGFVRDGDKVDAVEGGVL